jgi:hypothetical protein
MSLIAIRWLCLPAAIVAVTCLTLTALPAGFADARGCSFTDSKHYFSNGRVVRILERQHIACHRAIVVAKEFGRVNRRPKRYTTPIRVLGYTCYLPVPVTQDGLPRCYRTRHGVRSSFDIV